MKKSLFLILALLFSCSIFAQNRASFIKEYFDSGDFPSDWTKEGLGINNWEMRPSNNAGGEAGEIRLYWSPAFIGTARLVTPSINLSNVDEVIFSFKGCLNHYNDVPHQVGIAISTDDGATWNIAWQETFSYEDNGQHSFLNTIEIPEEGRENVKFCLFYDGDSNNLTAWYFDDIEIYSLDELNLEIVSTEVPNIIGMENTSIDFTVKNVGASTIETFRACYMIDGEIMAEEIFETNIASSGMESFVFNTPLLLMPGPYTLSIVILDVNNEEDITEDNTITKDIVVAYSDTQRIPLIEHFSSSTCGPCVYTNSTMGTLTANNPGKFAYVKYPVNWPGLGDPYSTDESMIRKSYYPVTGAPHLFMDGEDYGGQPISSQAFAAAYDTPAYVDIKGAYTIEGNTITVSADVISYLDMENTRFFFSVNEKTTTGNVGTNGETEFHHITMKMLNDAYGNNCVLNMGEHKHFEFSYDMSTTFVEEMNDLEVAAWLQNYETREVYNSRFLYENTSHPYPVQNLELTKQSLSSFEISWEAPQEGNPTGYDLYVNKNLVLSNTNELSYTFEDAPAFNLVKVIAKYENNKESIPLVNKIDISEVPCLAPTELNASVEENDNGAENKFTVTLSWESSDNALEYAVYLDNEFLTNTSETSYEVYFNEEGEHNFSVATICENGESEQSEIFDFVITETSLNENEKSFEICPNPAKDHVRISGNNISTVSIYNVIGIMVERLDVNSDEVEINTSKYDKGMYLISIQDKEGNKSTKKLLVE